MVAPLVPRRTRDTSPLKAASSVSAVVTVMVWGCAVGGEGGGEGGDEGGALMWV